MAGGSREGWRFHRLCSLPPTLAEAGPPCLNGFHSHEDEMSPLAWPIQPSCFCPTLSFGHLPDTAPPWSPITLLHTYSRDQKPGGFETGGTHLGTWKGEAPPLDGVCSTLISWVTDARTFLRRISGIQTCRVSEAGAGWSGREKSLSEG